MYTRNPKNLNMTGQKQLRLKTNVYKKTKEPKHDRPKQLRLNTCIQENQRT